MTTHPDVKRAQPAGKALSLFAALTIACVSSSNAAVSSTDVRFFGTQSPQTGSIYTNYYYNNVRLFSNGTTGVIGSDYTQVSTVEPYASKGSTFYNWAKNKYVTQTTGISWLNYTGNAQDQYNSTWYSVTIKSSPTPTPTPAPTPKPTATPTPNPGVGGSTNLNNREYGGKYNGWTKVGYPSDLVWRKLWPGPFTHEKDYLAHLAKNLADRGYDALSAALKKKFPRLSSVLTNLWYAIETHKSKSVIDRWKRKLKQLTNLEAQIKEALTNVELPDGSAAEYDVRVPAAEFARRMHTTFLKGVRGKDPWTNAGDWVVPACPSFSTAPNLSLQPGLNTFYLAVNAPARFTGFFATMRAYAGSGASIYVVIVAPDGSTWDFTSQVLAGVPVRSDGFMNYSLFGKSQAFDADTVPSGTWQFQITFTAPPNVSVAGNPPPPQTARLNSIALTFFPNSVW